LAIRRLRPYVVYLGLELFLSLFVSMATATVVVYWVSTGHLNPLQLLLLGTAVEGAYFLLQLPTGALADLVSRRLSVIAGVAVLGVAYIVQSLSPGFGNLLAAQVLIALGAALVYGALEAWIAGELPEVEMAHTYVRATQIGLAGTIIGSILSGLLMLEGANVALLAGGVGICVLAAVLAIVMPEHNVTPDADVSVLSMSWEHLAAQARATAASVRAVPGLLLLFGMTAFLGMWSESFDRLWGDFFIVDIHFPSSLSTPLWFSFIAGAVAVVALVTTEVAKRRVDRLGPSSLAGTLLTVMGLTVVCVVVMTLSHGFALALIGYFGVASLRPVYEPLVSGWMVRRVDERVRATALSAREMFDSGGQIAGGPVFGLIGVWVSVRAALLVGGAVLVPAIGMLIGAGRAVRGGRAPARGLSAEP
jgi:MFS transporter, DHA3 family, tetracycline resistance protein